MARNVGVVVEIRILEPCASCKQSTAAGRSLFPGRRAIVAADGSRSYLCAECDARITATRRGRQLSDAEVRRFVDNGAMAAIHWNGGIGGGIGPF